MNLRTLFTAIALSSMLFAGCGQECAPGTSSEKSTMMNVADMKTPTSLAVQIEGMSCPSGCAAKIQNECSKLPGVGKSEVNFNEKMGHFTFDASKLSETDIIKCIEATNGGGIYSATKVETDDAASPAIEEPSDTATTEEALHVVKQNDRANV